MFKKTKISVLLKVGPFVFLSVFFLFCLLWFLTTRVTEETFDEALKHAQTEVFIKEKYIDHILYFIDLEAHVFQDKPFKKTLDPKKCDFGKWYYSHQPSAFEEQVFKLIEEPHRRFHATAEAILATTDRQKKIDILINQSYPIVLEIKSLFDKLVDIREHQSKKLIEEFSKQQQIINYVLWTTFVIIVLLTLTIGYPIVRKKILEPLNSAVTSAQLISSGDIGQEIKIDKQRDDEFTVLLKSLEHMRINLQRQINVIVEASQEVNSSVGSLSESIKKIISNINEQTTRTSQVATSTTEMSQTVIDIAKHASNIASSAVETSDTAKSGETIMQNTVDEVQKIAMTVEETARLIQSLGERSIQIGEIVSVIKDIADQTNLLALNAAIEAARAGEQGRGFAVVADEVRKLAERTGKATTEISTMISAIQNETERAVKSMQSGAENVKSGVQLAIQAGESLQNIVKKVADLQTMVQQIASATEEMSTVTEQINSDIETIDTSAKETSSATAGISDSSRHLTTLSDKLKSLISYFKT